MDEIVVVDTGSVDNTPHIAEHHGARVYTLPWTGDFSVARNAALERASGTWILYIDADERLCSPKGQCLSVALDAKAYAGMMVRLHPRPRHTAYAELRLFLRDPRIRFEGRIHEQILPSVLAVCSADGKSVADSNFALQHVGYEGDLRHKHARNLPLLEQAVKERPDRLYCWYHLGETLAGVGQLDSAEQALRRGIAIGRKRNTSTDRAEVTLCYQRLATVIAERGCDPRDIIMEGLRNKADDHCLRLLAAKAEIDFGNSESILPELAALATIDAASFFDPLIAYDRRTFNLWPHALTGVANFRLGNFAEASRAFRRAAKSPDASIDEQIEYSAKAEVAAARSGRFNRA